MKTTTTVIFNELEIKQLLSQVTRGLGGEVPVERLVIENLVGYPACKEIHMTFSVLPAEVAEANN